jgi:hypothetical protein
MVYVIRITALKRRPRSSGFLLLRLRERNSTELVKHVSNRLKKLLYRFGEIKGKIVDSVEIFIAAEASVVSQK